MDTRPERAQIRCRLHRWANGRIVDGAVLASRREMGEKPTMRLIETKPTVLVVDDVAENLQLLTSALKDDYNLRFAKSGTKALALASQAPVPDLVLLDVMMPDLDGFQVCAKLKQNPATTNIPVIFITALSAVDDETRGFEVGGADFITKPFHPAVVQARVRTHLALRAAQARADALLRVLLPENVIRDLYSTGEHRPDVAANVSILFCDFINFSLATSNMDPALLIGEMSEIFGAFDDISARHGAYRIKTIGDAYMAATGLTSSLGAEENARALVEAAREYIRFLARRNETASQVWRCRIGIHSGAVIAGIVGKNRFLYDIMGHDVNVAARVESAALPMHVTISDVTRQLIGEQYQAAPLGPFNLKGHGPMNLFAIAP